MLDERLTVEELGSVSPCDNCGKLTYLPKDRPYARLPKGFTHGNVRHYIAVRLKRMTVCETCRYDVYGAW